MLDGNASISDALDIFFVPEELAAGESARLRVLNAPSVGGVYASAAG